MNFLPTDLAQFVNQHTSEEPEILTKLDRLTHLKTLKPRMLSGHYQGRFLSMISKISKPQNILEIGTFTGYSALCLAEGLDKNGQLTTIDSNEETLEIATMIFAESAYPNQITTIKGNALAVIPTLNSMFDLIFIDADKENYLAYYQLCFSKLNIGGIILADNVLWSGKVVEENAANDKKTNALIQFCDFVQSDTRVENILFPIRDGLMMVKKMEE